MKNFKSNKFHLDNSPSFDGMYDQDVNWNGYKVPMFTLPVLTEIIEHINEKEKEFCLSVDKGDVFIQDLNYSEEKLKLKPTSINNENHYSVDSINCWYAEENVKSPKKKRKSSNKPG